MKQEFRISAWAKWLYGLTGIGMFIFSIYLFATYNHKISIALLSIPILMIICSILIFVNLSRRSIIITDKCIECVSLFSRRELALDEIKGCRVESKIIYIEPLYPDKPTVRIGNYIDFKNSDQLVNWCNDHFKDLNAIDLENEQKEISSNPYFGTGDGARVNTFTKTRRLAFFYNGLGFFFSFILIFYNSRADIAALLFYPILGIFIIWIGNGNIKLFSNSKRTIVSPIILGMLLPCFLLLIKSFVSYQILQINKLWLPSLIVTAIMFLLLYKIGINRKIDVIGTQVFIILITTLLYGFGSIRQINCAFDNSLPKIYTATVLRHRISHGRSTSYFITLNPWGPVKTEQETEVRKSIYYSIEPDEKVKVFLENGLINIPWFYIKEKALL